MGREGHLQGPLQLLTPDRPVQGLEQRHTGGQGASGCEAQTPSGRSRVGVLQPATSTPTQLPPFLKWEGAQPCTHICSRSWNICHMPDTVLSESPPELSKASTSSLVHMPSCTERADRAGLAD